MKSLMLVVDEKVNTRVIAETLLRSRGWPVRWACDEAEVLQGQDPRRAAPRLPTSYCVATVEKLRSEPSPSAAH